jgi:hypothetical protein
MLGAVMASESDTPQAIDRTPDAASTPGEGTSTAECPYVTGTVTRYCTLTPLTLTDAEREAIEYAADAYDYKAADAYAHNEDDARYKHIAATLRGLLERTRHPERD